MLSSIFVNVVLPTRLTPDTQIMGLIFQVFTNLLIQKVRIITPQPYLTNRRLNVINDCEFKKNIC